MVNWNPSFPEVLGNEYLGNIGLTTRVWFGAPAAMGRFPSTVAETIASLKLSATVNPLLRADARTLVDVIEEGQEVIPLFSPVYLAPNVDLVSGGWRRNDGSTTNLFQGINESTRSWPGPASTDWIQNGLANEDAYECRLDATPFKAAGSHVNGRIGFVSISAILGANTGFRKLRIGLDIGGVGYAPAGGSVREVHGYGAMYTLWYGEINPATEKPWTPADIALFDSVAGTSKLRVQTVGTSGTQYPIVYALALEVYAVTTENRAAVGIYRRPETVPGLARLQNVTTDALVTLPAGTANWSKLSARNYLLYWRQSVCPSLFGPLVADDVRWNLVRQNLGPAGNPPGYAGAPGGVALAATGKSHDNFGRPVAGFAVDSARSIMTAAMVRNDAALSVDSQPYRLDVDDLELVTSTQKLGQRVVPGSAQTYLGVRFPIIPPASGDPTLTVAIIRISDSVQIGGTFTITGSAARALPAGPGGWRYVSGFLSSGAALASGIAYEVRVTSTAGGNWTMAMPDASLAPTTSFGGNTSGAFLGATHLTDRDLSINLTRQPDPPTSPTVASTDVAVTTFTEVATTVKHVLFSWTLPAVGMGANFYRYEVERQYGTGPWQPIYNINVSTATNITDRECARFTAASYRVRAVGKDGRFSAWATSSSITLNADARPMLVLSSNHDAAISFVHLYEITDSADGETVYPILSSAREETVAIHGADYQIVFMEAEDRGVGWRTRVSLKQSTLTAKGIARFDPLLDAVRALTVPYVCAMDHQGTQLLGHVSVDEGVQIQPDYRYAAQLEIIPTHVEPVPAEVVA